MVFKVLWSNTGIMMANKFSDMSLLRMIEGLAKDGYASNKFLPEGWRVRYITKCFKN